MDWGLTGKRAVVTGAAGGIGLAVVRGLAVSGCHVVATDLDQPTALPGNCEWQSLNVASTADVTKFFSRQQDFDILVNCAGQISRGGEHQESGFAETIDVNLLGTMRTCYAARELLAVNSGCVVNVASMLSFFGSGPAPGYSASKGGVAQLTKSLAIAWAEDQIRVNAIAPGWIATSLTQPLRDDENRNRQILERTPVGRWGEPEDVVGGVLFLCSAAAHFITGTILPIDGGYHSA